MIAIKYAIVYCKNVQSIIIMQLIIAIRKSYKYG